MQRKNKGGQIAMWVIIAAIIVAAILVVSFVRNMPTLTEKNEFDPGQYVQQCTRDAANKAIDKMLLHGGFLEPKNFKVYNDIKIEYLCQNEGYYKPCINLHPMLLNEINKQIKGEIEPEIEQCFQSMKDEAESRNVVIEMGLMDVNVSLAPGKVVVGISRDLTITEGSSKRKIDQFDVDTVNPAYDLTRVAIEIVNQEAKYCYFEYAGYMAINHDVDIRKFVMSDSTKIYSITDKKSGITMNIATRGCAIPPGLI